MTRKSIDLSKLEEQIIDLVKNNLPIGKFCEEHNVCYDTLIKYLKKRDLYEKWKNGRYWVRRTSRIKRSYIEAVVEDDLTLQQIADHEGITRERVRQYINEKGLYDKWADNRSERV